MANNYTHLNDTIVALATPPGVGAIGVIRLSGAAAIDIIDQCFKGKNLKEQASHTIHFGSIRNEQNHIIDEVLVSLFIGPKSYTGEHVVEVSCHGSNYILQQVIQLFIENGARMAQPGEFTLRAFLNGRMDLSQAEFANRDNLKTLVQKIRGLLRALIDSFQLGNVIKNGINTVIAGRPNAGKSTLLNALLNEERAIVSEIAGTTRDTIEEVLNIQGIEFRLIDTAGIRDAQDQIEAIGVEKTLEKIQQSAVLLYVFDVVQSPPEEVRKDLEKLVSADLQFLVIANKMDLNPYTKAEHYINEFLPAEHFLPVSALNKMNIDYLKERLHELVIDQQLIRESTIVSNVRHFEALSKAEESLGEVLNGLASGITADFVAMDIRRALQFLGEITGEISTDDLLGNIFGKFCIGK